MLLPPPPGPILRIRLWGRIDVLVNSAGNGPRAPILEITDEQWRSGLDIYFMNVIRPTRLVAPIMQTQKSGAEIVADTFAADNVRMNNVLPGWIDSWPVTEEARRSIPMGRYGRVEEIAATIAFLASEGAAYVTGQNIRIDGGLTRAV
jgi:NAD(P)-dependent dehydrogenase (short-subunit alcohol dehydrogenase family)